MTHHLDMMHAIAGLLVGVLVGLTGVGGGSLMTPLLVLMFGVNPQTAVGTDLLFAALTKICGSVVHGKRETVEWSIVRRLAAGSVPAAIVTLAALAYIGKIGKSTENVILFSLAILLFITALAVASRKWLAGLAKQSHHLTPPATITVLTVVLGVVIGIAVSISSVGAGAIGVTVLLLLYPRLPVARLVGSDIAHAVPLAMIAGIGHWIIGDVDLTLLANLLIGSIPGVVIGSYLSSHASDRVLQPLLACVLAISSWQLMVKSRMSDTPKAPAHAITTESAVAH